jgi:hypothetical protein
MAMGKTAQCTTAEVAAHCKSLEVSPSVNTGKTSNVYASGGHTVKQKEHPTGGKSVAKGGTEHTSSKFGSAHAKKGH